MNSDKLNDIIRRKSKGNNNLAHHLHQSDLRITVATMSGNKKGKSLMDRVFRLKR